MHNDHDSDISLKELFINIEAYFRMLLKSWKTIGLSALLFGILILVFNLNQPPEYKADLTFMLNVDERGKISGITSILGQFGLGMSNSESNLDKIIELSKSRKITEATFFQETEFNGSYDLLANHLIDVLEKENLWYKKSLFSGNNDSLNLSGFRFGSDSLNNFSLLENKALKRIHSLMISDGKSKSLFNSSFDELSGIMNFNVTSPDEILSIQIVNQFFENLSQYYIHKAIEKQKYDYDIIKEKYDSINYALNRVQYAIADFEDSNKEIFRKQDVLQKNRLRNEEQKLQFMSGKAEEQLQIAQISLENKTPYIQLIDRPISPLKPINKAIYYYFIIGALIGLIISAFYLVLIKMYKDIMASNI